MSNKSNRRRRLVKRGIRARVPYALHVKAEEEACLTVARNLIASEYAAPELRMEAVAAFDALPTDVRERLGRNLARTYREARAEAALEKP